MRLPSLSYANVVATLALVSVGGGLIAVSHAQTTAKPITACVKKKGGAIRIASKCKKTERKLTWSVAGPRGLTGDRGPAGPAGAPGTAGGTGTSGTTGTASATPSGLVGYFDASTCPVGWTEYLPGRGRYAVGLTPAGALGTTVGTALSDGEDRPTGQHTHGVQDPGHSHQVWTKSDRLTVPGTNSIAGNLGSALNLLPAWDESVGGNEGIAPAFTGITISPAGAVAGTNAPYVQLLACRKD